MFRGAELTRLLTSVTFLVVLGMLIVQARDGRNWRWLCGQQAASGSVDAATLIHGRPADDAGNAGLHPSFAKKKPQGAAAKGKTSPVAGATGGLSASVAEAQGAKLPAASSAAAANAAAAADRTKAAPLRVNGKPLDLPPPPTGPTDLDEDERGAAAQEFEAITDRTLELHPEEMNAYWRLFSWVQNQSLAGLSKRAVKDVVMNDFIQSPDDFRGQLVALELNVRRVLRHPATKNRLGIKNIYEVTGFTTESQAWLYFGLTAELPKDMPIGSTVEEQATFYGYFFKLQGYYRAGAKPDERPLAAPVLIGRIVWHSAAAAEARGESFSQLFWAVIVGASLLVAGGIWLIIRLTSGRSAAARAPLAMPTVPMDQWLQTAAEGGLEIDGAEADPLDWEAVDGDRPNDRPYGGRLGGLRSVGKPGDSSGGNGFSNGR
jgi:hypothetical protein